MRLLFHHADTNDSGGSSACGESAAPRPLLTMLVSHAPGGGGDWREQPLAVQLPRLLQPLGIRCVSAQSGDEATQVIRSITIHIAVVDLSIPLRHSAAQPGEALDTRNPEAGPRVLQLLRRLDQPPPTIVIRPPQPSMRDSGRTLAEVLREGAFSVLDRPVQLEAMLDALRRIVRRHYRDHWPAA